MTGPETGHRLRITGRVQGVGYRDWAVRTARSLGLSGWVRNRSDGSVEASVSGEAGAVRGFVEACGRGPPAARVDGIDQQPEPADASIGFTALPTL